MSTIQKILFFFVLPLIAPLLYPPQLIFGTWFVPLIAAIFFIGLGILLIRGNSTVLTLSIFIQGLNVIIRLMMFFPNLLQQGQFNSVWLITSVLSIALSTYLLLRLDRTDVRVTMVT